MSSDRRRTNDRRTQQARAFFCMFFMNRREGVRREEDQRKGHYVDVHEPVVLAVTLGALLLCVADAYLTLMLIQLGGRELNPLMNLLIEKDVNLFITFKYVLTSLCLIFTVIHKKFKLFDRVSGYHILYSVFFVYLLLVKYEIDLLTY